MAAAYCNALQGQAGLWHGTGYRVQLIQTAGGRASSAFWTLPDAEKDRQTCMRACRGWSTRACMCVCVAWFCTRQQTGCQNLLQADCTWC